MIGASEPASKGTAPSGGVGCNGGGLNPGVVFLKDCEKTRRDILSFAILGPNGGRS